MSNKKNTAPKEGAETKTAAPKVAAETKPAAEKKPPFKTIKMDWMGQTITKILGPGTNPEEIKFEGDQEGPFYVHCRAGGVVEVVKDHAKPSAGYFVRYGGTEEDCHAYCSR